MTFQFIWIIRRIIRYFYFSKKMTQLHRRYHLMNVVQGQTSIWATWITFFSSINNWEHSFNQCSMELFAKSLKNTFFYAEIIIQVIFFKQFFFYKNNSWMIYYLWFRTDELCRLCIGPCVCTVISIKVGFRWAWLGCICLSINHDYCLFTPSFLLLIFMLICNVDLSLIIFRLIIALSWVISD